MKRFRFPLTPVKVVRTQAKQRAQEKFAHAVQAYVAAEEHLAATRRRVAELEESMREERGPGFLAAGAVSGFVAYRREAAAEVEAEQKVFAAKAEMEARRTDYLEAHRKLEVVNRLETKARVSYQHELRREEQIDFDEFAGRLHAARRNHVAL